MVSVPVRADVLGLAATLKPTGPLPLPLAPLVTVIQLSLLAADHAQPVPDVTLVDPVPPAATTDKLFDEIANVQPAAACVTVKDCVPMLIDPTLDVPVVLADTV
jgi:hypothetical protein